MYMIEKAIPLPARRGGPGATPKYPFRQMKTGDSFYVNGGKPLGTVSSAATYYSTKSGFKFACRTEKKGVRVWRVK